MIFLVFSDDFVHLTKPAFGDIDFPTLPKHYSFPIVFTLDILGAGVLMGITGGSRDSPFSAVLFSLPALSIFLRESPTSFFTYTALTVVMFLFFSLFEHTARAILENPKHNAAFQVVTLGCLALSTLVGYATRPL